MSSYPKTGREQTANSCEQLLSNFAAHQSNYWVGFFSDPATVVFFIFWEAVVLRSDWFRLAACYATGLLGWTLFEYVFHRWVYHRGRTLAHAGHRMHHESPTMLIGMPWFMTTGFLWGVWYLFAYMLQIRYVLGLMAGLTTGFVVYGAIHHTHHHFNLSRSWLRKLNAHHNIHHRFHDVNFGVTNRFWDQVFGTTYQRQRGSVLKAREPASRNAAAGA